MIWLLPSALVVVANVAVLVGVRRVAAEAVQLRSALVDLASLRQSVDELRYDVRALRAAVPELRRSRSRESLAP